MKELIVTLITLMVLMLSTLSILAIKANNMPTTYEGNTNKYASYKVTILPDTSKDTGIAILYGQNKTVSLGIEVGASK